MRTIVSQRYFARSVLMALAASLLGSACSSSSSGDPGVAPQGGEDAAADAHVRDPNLNCVPPGTPNNSKGFGAYCTKGGTECGKGALCTADYPGTPENNWFCTTPCTTNEECGAGVRCQDNDVQKACVPISCLGTVDDAGVGDAPGGAVDASGDVR